MAPHSIYIPHYFAFLNDFVTYALHSITKYFHLLFCYSFPNSYFHFHLNPIIIIMMQNCFAYFEYLAGESKHYCYLMAWPYHHYLYLFCEMMEFDNWILEQIYYLIPGSLIIPINYHDYYYLILVG